MSYLRRNCYFVRHSERADQIDKKQWLSSMPDDPNRNPDDYHNDTTITDHGVTLAKTVAHTLVTKDIIPNIGDNKVIFASRMRRCVQTAYYIAKELNIPIILSSGLALTVTAVSRRGVDKFNFWSIADIKQYCQGVVVINGDNYDEIASLPEGTLPKIALSKASWYEALDSIVLNQYIPSIIVLHSEIIYTLAESDVKPPADAPYCCIGDVTFVPGKPGHNGKYDLSELYDYEGTKIFSEYGV